MARTEVVLEGKVEVNGVNLWYRISGEGEPVVQIHGAGFGHFNFDLATPELSRHFRVVDYDMRGYGQSDRPVQRYDMEVWADDLAGLMDALEIERAHVHGTSMGGMIAIVFAGKYLERTGSVVINCAAAKLGRTGRRVFRNRIGIARLDRDGPGSRTLAEFIAWQAFSKGRPQGPRCTGRDRQHAAHSARVERSRGLHGRLPGPVRRGRHGLAAEDRCPGARAGRGRGPDAPVGPGPEGADQEAIWEGVAGAENHGIRGSGHSTIFDNSEEHNRVVVDRFRRRSLVAA